ncbi:MAG: GTP-binding protein [Methanocalculus sp. MSAO_Arc1]|uniref:GTP-binding protein n=1 Tax=Methanocalculus TaxID=71151 RepID=UPI000FF5AC4D|nr:MULTISPECIES: GTP-binding protein [unclassified Methanocalculus]MCP1662309.1 small GTP-binding protein [Methanocalculus sp. AMF5]RQD80929.1 MAG: GTP-binding protein [Methanocalculus sp. MSAO_Arc1]
MIYSGIDALDGLLAGGVPDGSRILFAIEPEADGQHFMITMLHTAVISGKRALVIAPFATKDAYLADVASQSHYHLDCYRDQIHYLDSTDAEAIREDNPDSERRRNAWKEKIEAIITNEEVDIIFVYLDILSDDFEFAGAVSLFEDLRGDRPITVAFEYFNMFGSEALDPLLRETPFDLIISLQSGSGVISYFNFFTIHTISWLSLPARSLPYIVSDGHIVPYIPKIVITGPSNAGKTTFVKNISESGISVDRLGLLGTPTTVALDIGHMATRGFDINIYGTPGQERFDPIIPQLARNAMGVILMVDVTQPELMPRAKDLKQIVEGNSVVPVIVVANKADLDYSVTEEVIRSELEIRPDTPVYFISAYDRRQCRNVIDSMVDQITTFPY